MHDSIKSDINKNYSAIALSSVFGKNFDKIVIEKQVEQLGTSELQFGYKTKRSTVMCSAALTETIEYYHTIMLVEKLQYMFY